ncbi:MAG: Flp pilus assembly complex ATPase component TadA, partial [Gammaproteobacteria bacterium]|nr:Flp pilus assembly complex ATPase component TadA [Gammaproteobacteria bacterium]
MNAAAETGIDKTKDRTDSHSFEFQIDTALSEVPRHDFFQDTDDTLAGVVGKGIPSDHALRKLVRELDLSQGARVLHIGTGSGYAAAVLSHIATEVFSIERMSDVAELARSRLQALGYRNVTVLEGNGFRGLPDLAPFDAILISVRGKGDLKALKSQLTVGGTLVGTHGRDRHNQTIYKLKRVNVTSCTKKTLGEISTASDIGEIMVAISSANEKLVAAARERAHAEGTSLEDEIRKLVAEDEAELYKALAVDRGMKFSDAESLIPKMDSRAFENTPSEFLSHNRMVPLHEEKGIVFVATSDPDTSVTEVRRAFDNQHIRLRLVTPTDLRRLRAAFDLSLHEPDLTPAAEPTGPDEPSWRTNNDSSVDAHYVSLLDAMLLDAVAKRASDLHLEQYEHQVVVRLRIDGDLQPLASYKLTPDDLARLINVIKIRAKLDISEQRLPQGGRASLLCDGRNYDLRVQTQPCLYGEHAVIRLLPQQSRLLSIEELGFPAEVAAQYRRLLAHPAGLVLVVGPTGSGKSTTLYAGLGELANDQRRKVITAEDPIEYAISGVQQTQVRPEVGFHFADAMRAFVREDPDVILVGEIRDSETALEAIRAAQTGHLVLSTLHCNDAVDAVQRLFDLGMHPNSIASELLAVAAQKLAKRLCVQCRAPASPEPEIAAEVFPNGVPH